MKKYKFKVADLDCANCARKVENYLNKDKKLNNVILNFNKLTLSLETDLSTDVKTYVTKLTQEVEPDMKILELHEELNNKRSFWFRLIKLILGTILGCIGIFIENTLVSKILIISAYILLLSSVFIHAIKLLFKSFTINENMLLCISCIGAYLTNNIHEGLMVIILYEVGKVLESIAVNNSRKSIANLMDIKPEYANLKQGSEIIKKNPEEININDIIIVRKGEKIPLDGIIVAGETKLNTIALTGESKLREVHLNEEVLSGSINEENIIEIKVTKDYENSTVTRILELVENASDRKAASENFVASAARIYTPIIILLAVLAVIILPLFPNITLETAIYRALTFLVISCPCAIAISVPLSYFTGLGLASKKGILIKGSDYLDSLRHVNKIIFDKTGTITTGEFSSYNLTILDENYQEDEIIDIYLKGESYSTHPIGKSIINYYNKKINTKDVSNFKEESGKGISFNIKDDKYKIGSSIYVKSSTKDSAIYLAKNNKVIAKLEKKDTIKKQVKETISALNKLNIKTMMFTGDEKNTSLEIAEKAGIKEIKYELLPEDKYHLLEQEIKNNDGKIAFIGDGINDAPSIRLADIGISMGSIGSASAIEASDIVIADDNLNKIIDAINISKKTTRIIKQNLIFAISIKIIAIILSALGIASMWQAVFADTGVTLIAILNTTRILKK